MQSEGTATDLYDMYRRHLPDREDLERLDTMLSDMLARTQSELDRLAPKALPTRMIFSIPIPRTDPRETRHGSTGGEAVSFA
jgi:hypothetical protein